MKRLFILICCFIIGGFIVNAQCVDNGNYWNESWISCSTSANPNPARANSHWILYEFHENQTIDTSYVWNANRAGESGWGAKDVIVDYSEDGTTWTELGAYTFPQANESDTYSGFLGPIFGGTAVNKILITILNSHDGGSCASIAEVQFRVNCMNTWYEDADNDGLGNELVMIDQCEQPVGYVSNSDDRCDNGALGFEDMLTIFTDNGCTNCHNSSPTSGLDLTTYANLVTGGNQCNDLTTGTVLSDIISMGYSCDSGNVPAMNSYVGGSVDATELASIQDWIDGGAPEFCEDFCFSNCEQIVNVQLKFFVEGPYNITTGTMNTDLYDTNLLPKTQPYTVAPYNYMGTETVTTFPASNIVDWVLVQARDAINLNNITETRACFLLNDGTLMDIDGTTGVNFTTLDSSVRYRFVVYHKGHLGVLTATDIDVPTTMTYDFTTSDAQAVGIEQLKLKGSSYVLYSGDYDNNGIINNLDFNKWQANSSAVNQYLHWDADCNGIINNFDYNFWTLNRSKVGEPIIAQ